ncbi:hypothetical protein CEXT_396871 [Caerostris extrusa]|uniref:Uncharacterized protein n=1 Tax=Caerostris extrusa TaxID=172846 RepID=A0AAV4Q644_CAEEX|nr:hypothetical protein CEXT_396871 [Caerostris extrusa]
MRDAFKMISCPILASFVRHILVSSYVFRLVYVTIPEELGESFSLYMFHALGCDRNCSAFYPLIHREQGGNYNQALPWSPEGELGRCPSVKTIRSLNSIN